MSETVAYAGTIRMVPNPAALSMDDLMRSLMAPEDMADLDTVHDGDVQDCFWENHYDDYVKAGDDLYKIEKCTGGEADDIMDAYPQSDGSVAFVVQYYTGGCSFGEAVSEALKKMRRAE